MRGVEAHSNRQIIERRQYVCDLLEVAAYRRALPRRVLNQYRQPVPCSSLAQLRGWTQPPLLFRLRQALSWDCRDGRPDNLRLTRCRVRFLAKRGARAFEHDRVLRGEVDEIDRMNRKGPESRLVRAPLETRALHRAKVLARASLSDFARRFESSHSLSPQPNEPRSPNRQLSKCARLQPKQLSSSIQVCVQHI